MACFWRSFGEEWRAPGPRSVTRSPQWSSGRSQTLPHASGLCGLSKNMEFILRWRSLRASVRSHPGLTLLWF